MFFKLAWRNIWRNKRRTIITISSITFAVLLSCIMRSMQLGSYERMIDNAVRFYLGFIQVHQTGYWDDKTIDNSFEESPKLLQSIEAMKKVSAAVPRLESFALTSYKQKTRGALVLGIEPEKEDHLTEIREKLVEGTFVGKEDNGVMIAEGLASYLNISINDTLVLLSQGYHGVTAAGLFPVKGVLKFPSPAQNNQSVFLPLKKAQWFYGAENRLTSIALVLSSPKHVDEVKLELQEMVSGDQEVMDWLEMMPELIQSIELDNISGQIMLFVLYLVVGFGMFGTFLMMTNERMQEFGILLAVGMKRFRMQSILFLEMAILSSMGVATGILLAYPIIQYFNINPIYFTGDAAEVIEKFGVEPVYVFSLNPSIFYNQAYTIFFMALVFGLYPLWVIYKLDIVNAMRR